MKTLLNFAPFFMAALFALAIGYQYLPFYVEERKAPAKLSASAGPAPAKHVQMQVQLMIRANGLNKYNFSHFEIDIWAKDLRTAMQKFTKQVEPISIQPAGQHHGFRVTNFFNVEIAA